VDITKILIAASAKMVEMPAKIPISENSKGPSTWIIFQPPSLFSLGNMRDSGTTIDNSFPANVTAKNLQEKTFSGIGNPAVKRWMEYVLPNILSDGFLLMRVFILINGI
jgi:hypothetical protein